MQSVTSLNLEAVGRSRQYLQLILYGILGLAVITFATISPAMAAPPVEGTGCILDQPGNVGVNCNSNDITLSSPVVTVLDPCDFPGDFAQLQVLVDITNNATTRYDIGVWLSIDGDPNGDGSASGLCSVLSVDPTVLQTDGLLADFDGDQCGDVKSTTNLVDISQVDLGTVSLLCNDTDGDGLINVPVITSWQQNSNSVCTVSTQAFPVSSPKCTDNRDLTIDVPVPGRITVDKVTVPSDDTLFQFNLSGPVMDPLPEGGFDGSHDFELSDTDPVFDTATFTGGITAGVYSVSESPDPGYFTEISCTGSEGAEDPAAIDVAAGETVNCVFTNTLDSATINVVKNTVGGNGLFAVNWFGPTTSGGVALDTGVINTDTETIVTSETGTFTLTELIPDGWALGNAACFDDNGGAGVGTWDTVDTINGIDLVPGQSVTCTFTNQAIGTVMLVKNTVGGDGSFDFVTDVPGLGTNIQTSGGSGMTSASDVPAGTYSIVETVPAGWALESATCDDGSPPDALVLTANETVTCTFVDIKLGTVIVEKQTVPDGDLQQFDFTGDIVGTIGDGGQIVVSNLLPATYVSTEIVPEGWDLTSIVCDDGNSTGDTEAGSATFNIEAGETVTCVFTNTKDGSIEVVKSLSATGPADETFGFTSNFNGAFNLIGDAATTGPIAVAPGSGYTVSEDDPTASGWANTGASCGDGSDPLTNIDVAPGEAVVCTFINSPLGSATIIKDTIGGNGIFGFTGDAPIGPFSLDTTDQFTATTGDLFNFILTAGIYDVTEDNIPSGFTLTSIECSDDSLTDVGTATASMDVQLAETVACTFTNTADGTLIIRKETIPDGVDQGFDFTGDAAGTLRDFSTFGEEIVVTGLPNTYTSAETVPEGWAITDINCEGQVQSGVTYGEVDVSVALAAGETVICTFVNSALGSITIEKLTQGGLGAFQFNSDLGAFQLDTLTNGNPDAISFSGLASGTYMFSEVIPENWTLSSIECQGQNTSTVRIGGEGGFDPGDQGVTIDLADGEAIVCTFVNDADGSIQVTKLTDPAGSAQSFDFTGAITASLTDGQSSLAILVPPGGYAVTESALAGWDITDISCSDDDSTGTGNTANFVVAPGEVVNCTFTNTIQRGNIVVEKQTDPDGSSQVFDFTSSYGGGFSLIDGQQSGSGPLLPTSEAGTYSVSETLPAGWELTSAICSDGSAADAIDLAPGETVTCVFTNTIQRGNIVVVKETVPDGSLELFGFTSNYGDAFSLADGQQNDSGPLLPTSEANTYSVAEDAKDGWNLESAVCSGDGNTPGSITLLPGETVTCTFTNLGLGSVTIVKQSDSDGTFQFDFSGPEFGAFLVEITTTGGTGQESFTDIPSGSYSVSEMDPAPFILLSATCDNGDDPADLTLDAGEDIVCTFVNGQPVPVPANSTWALLLLTLMLLATGLYFRPAAMRRF